MGGPLQELRGANRQRWMVNRLSDGAGLLTRCEAYLEGVMDSYDGPMSDHPGENAAKSLYSDIRAYFEERGEFRRDNPDRYR